MYEGFDDIISLLEADEFEERPVDVETFVQDKNFLGLPPLSEYQYQIVRAGSQIYRLESLQKLYGLDEADKRYRQTYNEVIMQLGKGSGKDFVSTIICAYVVYLLLCLKEPARYYGKPSDDSIDILNVAINAQQASNVFFAGFVKRITGCPWFKGKYNSTPDGRPSRNNEVSFIKNVNVYSAHSERESWEGYNVILVILDEIAGFAVDNNTGSNSAKTADAIYDMYSQSVTSRFPKDGKILLLSFPRFRGDFIQTRYDEVIATKETRIKKHTFKIKEDLPDGIEGNYFTIAWEEDHITNYKEPRVFALRRPTWDINPTINIDDFKRAFLRDPVDSLARFACEPPEAVDAFFKDEQVVRQTFRQINPISDSGKIDDNFQPDETKEYFVHVDLAQKHDRAAVAMAHVVGWQEQHIIAGKVYAAPKVIIDVVRWWTPTSDKSIDFTDIKDFILMLRRRGFNIKLVTFDRWNSHDMMMQLSAAGLNTDILSVALKHYNDFKVVMHDNRLVGPMIEILTKELLQLQIIKDKIDHPRSGSKDLSDAVCGSIFNAVSNANYDEDQAVEVWDWDSWKRAHPEPRKDFADNVIVAPKVEMPEDLADFLERFYTEPDKKVPDAPPGVINVPKSNKKFD